MRPFPPELVGVFPVQQTVLATDSSQAVVWVVKDRQG